MTKKKAADQPSLFDAIDPAVQAMQWLKSHTVKAIIGGVEQDTINSRELHEWLEVGRMYAHWIKERIGERKLKEGKDFVGLPNLANQSSKLDSPNLANQKRGRGGDRRSKDYLLTPMATKQILASDNSEKGRDCLDALIRFFDLAESGSPEVAARVIGKVDSAEGAERVIETAYEHFAEMYRKQGRSEQWIASRLHGKFFRSGLTDLLKECGAGKDDYAKVTCQMTEIAIGSSPAELKRRRGLSDRTSSREAMSIGELGKIACAEALAAEAVLMAETKSTRQCIDICLTQARRVAAV